MRSPTPSNSPTHLCTPRLATKPLGIAVCSRLDPSTPAVGVPLHQWLQRHCPGNAQQLPQRTLSLFEWYQTSNHTTASR